MSHPVAVLGAGHSGFGLAGDLALKGHAVHLFEHPDFTEVLDPVREAGGIAVRGVTGEGFASPARVTTSARDAVEGARVLFVVVPAYAHEAMAKIVAPHLDEGHTVVLMPGNAGGALAFREAVRDHGGPDVRVAEASSFIFACKKDGPAGVWIRGIKQGLPVGVFPSVGTDEVVDEIRRFVPWIAPAQDVLHTSLGNANHIAHPPALLLNVARIEAVGSDFSFFHEGMTRAVARLTEVLDEERMLVVDALGYERESTLEQLTRFYGDQGFGGRDYYEAVHTTPVHGAARAPATLDHRYFTEDVPFGLVPIVDLADTLDVPTPVLRGLVDVIGAVTGVDHWASGRRIAHLGLVGMDASEMRAYVRTGLRP